VETLWMGAGAIPVYKQYTGTPLAEVDPEAGVVAERIADLLTLKASILP
jgi:hypothetical protein